MCQSLAASTSHGRIAAARPARLSVCVEWRPLDEFGRVVKRVGAERGVSVGIRGARTSAPTRCGYHAARGSAAVSRILTPPNSRLSGGVLSMAPTRAASAGLAQCATPGTRTAGNRGPTRSTSSRQPPLAQDRTLSCARQSGECIGPASQRAHELLKTARHSSVTRKASRASAPTL